jgi:hypothetical protein
MSGVQDKRQPFLAAYIDEFFILPGVAAHTDEHHGAAARAQFPDHILGVKGDILINVGKDGLEFFIKYGVVGGNEGYRGGDDFIPVLPAQTPLKYMNGKVQTCRAGVDEVSMRQARIFFPGFLKSHSLEAEPRPSFLQALSYLLEALFHSKCGHKQLDVHSIPPHCGDYTVSLGHCTPHPSAETPTLSFGNDAAHLLPSLSDYPCALL